jgi:hypothetical protein
VKIQVRRTDSLIEILTLVEPLTIDRCSICGGAHLTTATGMIHFFDEEGAYDGFGYDLNGYTQEDADDFMKQADAGREFL